MSTPPTPEGQSDATCNCHAGEALLVVVLTNQAPQRDLEVPSAVNRAIRHYGSRLVKVSGSEVVELRIAGQNYRYFEPAIQHVFGLYDNAIVYLADDIEHVLEVTGHMGAASREYLVGPLPSELATEPTNLQEEQPASRVLRTLLPPENDANLKLIGIHVMKLGDHLAAALGPRLRCAVLAWIREMSGKMGVDVLAVPSWASTDIYVFSVHEDPKTIQPFIDKLHALSLGDLVKQGLDALIEPALNGVAHLATSGFVDTKREQADSGTSAAPKALIAAQILGAWKFGPWEFRAKPEALTVDTLMQSDVWYAARLHLARNQICKDRSTVGASDEDTALTIERAPPSPAERRRVEPATPQHEPPCVSPEGPPGRSHSAESEANLDSYHCSSITAVFLVQAKPGKTHLGAVHQRLNEIAGKWSAETQYEAKVLRSMDGEHFRPLLRIQCPSSIGSIRWIAYFSRWLREELSNDIIDVSTSLDLYPNHDDDTIGSQDEGTDADGMECHGRNDDAMVGQKNGAGDGGSIRGYQLLGPSNVREVEHLERFLLTRIGYGASERQAMLGFLSGVRHNAGDRDVFGALLEPLQVVELIRRELLSLVIQADINNAHILHDDLHQMMKFGQIAFQQRVQYTPLARGGLQMVAEVPFGINQLAMMMSGLTEIVLGVAYEGRSSRFEAHDVRKRSVVLTLFGQDNTFAIRQTGRLAVLRMNLLAAGSPLAMSLLFHELGHHIETICSMEDAGQGLGVDKGSIWRWRAAKIATKVVSKTLKKYRTFFQEALEIMMGDYFAHTVWRKIGCKNNWDVFEAQFLSCFSMGYVSKKLFGVGDRWTELWAISLAQLYVQAFVRPSAQREGFQIHLVGSLLIKYDFVSAWVKHYKKWWHPQCVPYGGNADVVEENLCVVVERLVALFNCASEGRAFQARNDRLHLCLRDVEDVTSKSNLTVVEDNVDRAGFSSVYAFVRCRDLIANFTRRWIDRVKDVNLKKKNGWRTTARDFTTQAFVGVDEVVPRGYFADITGRMFVFGADERRWWNKERSAVLGALMDISQDVRAGRMMRHFMYRRELIRFDYVEFCQLRPVGKLPDHSLESLNGLIVDVSSGGLRVLVPIPKQSPLVEFKFVKSDHLRLYSVGVAAGFNDGIRCVLCTNPQEVTLAKESPLLQRIIDHRAARNLSFGDYQWYRLHLVFDQGNEGGVGISSAGMAGVSAPSEGPLRPNLFFVGLQTSPTGQRLNSKMIMKALRALRTAIHQSPSQHKKGTK